MSKIKYPVVRNYAKTAYMSDCDIAKRFYNRFVRNDADPNNPFFGKLISNEKYNDWILSLGFKNMDHDWETNNEKKLWNTHRRIVRAYIKNGVMSEEYAKSSGYLPFSLEVKEQGQSLIITRFSDLVIDNFQKLSLQRQKNIRNKNRNLMRDFKVLTETYKMQPLKAMMQHGIIDAQNKMRLEFEKICGKVLDETVQNTVKAMQASLESSEQAVKNITQTIFDNDDDDINQEQAA